MILPTKHIRPERALLTIGADILIRLKQPSTVSRLWDEICNQHGSKTNLPKLTFDRFILSLDLLFMLGAISYENGTLTRAVK